MDDIEITLGERKIVVRYLRLRDSGNVERLRQAAIATPSDDIDVQNLREYFYPALSVAAKGDVPSEEEFLDIGIVEAGIWFAAFDKLNPGVLPIGDEEDKADEKKER